MDNLIIIGAGLSGLGAANHLKEYEIYESNSYPGGHAYSHKQKDLYWDEGAHICHSKNNDYLNLILKNIEFHHEKNTLNNNLYYGAKVGYPIQNNLKDLGFEDKVKALVSLHKIKNFDPSSIKNYRDWLKASYGDFITENFYEVFTKKYWNCKTSELSLDWLKGRLIQPNIEKIIRGSFEKQNQEDTVFSEFYYPKNNGYFGFYKNHFSSKKINFNHKVHKINCKNKVITFKNGVNINYDKIISSIPLKDMGGIVAEMPKSIKAKLHGLRATQGLYVNLTLGHKIFKEHWLYIYDENIKISRLFSQSNMSNNKTIFQVQLELYYDEKTKININKEIETAINDFVRLFKLKRNEINYVGHLYKKYSYVVADLNRVSNSSPAINWLEKNNIYQVGLYGRWKYIWSDEAYLSGYKMAQKISNSIY